MTETIDVSRWTRHHIGRKHPFWWGIWGLITIEVIVVGCFIVGFFYLWIVNAAEGRMSWPPEGTGDVPTLYPGIEMALLIVCSWSMWYGGIVMEKAQSRRFAWLVVVCCAASVLVLVFRSLQLAALPFSLGDNAYASFVWVLTGFHFLHVTSALLGTAAIGWLAAKGYYTEQRRLGVQVDTDYWYFVTGIWAPIYIVLYWIPRWFS